MYPDLRFLPLFALLLGLLPAASALGQGNAPPPAGEGEGATTAPAPATGLSSVDIIQQLQQIEIRLEQAELQVTQSRNAIRKLHQAIRSGAAAPPAPTAQGQTPARQR
ncbi:MAG TPA: hypothetical protein VEB64_05840 [Azospirillaceae bacterium]|nr:hypothetical protein [Azospirillaceae bacterium]